ncbi:MAG: GNAT family N-acetyltransferase [Candidatus Babeliales bacterium]
MIHYQPCDQQNFAEAFSFLCSTIVESQSSFLTPEHVKQEISLKKSVIEERIKAALIDDDKYVGIAKKDNKIVGFISARVVDDAVFIDYLYVDKNHRGQGIGPLLIKACIAELRALNIFSKIRLQVHTKNQRAIEKYYKEGFKQIGYKEKEDCRYLIMEREVDNYN